ncbi:MULTISPECIES: hypothetical protein [Cupriavidus]|uniref:hypothetical protein n=1 Tax=Cupriavidus sp. DF5525 TaxID=3160989 RepID=UPI0003B0B58A|nr:hypothetical protein N234_06745 [Ralstonia pickettii DTP0602]
MGNSKLAARCHAPPDAPDSYPVAGANGILARIEGHYIAAALRTLGSATRDGPSHREVLVDAGHAGTVRLFIEKKRARHGRYTHYFWSAYRAEPEQAP